MSNLDLTPNRDEQSILRFVQHDVSEMGKTVAAIIPQLQMLVEMVRQMQEQISSSAQRQGNTDRDLVALRERVVSLERRPTAASMEEQVEARGTVKAILDQQHQIANIVQKIQDKPEDFTITERQDMKRLLNIALRRGVEDTFEAREVDGLRRMYEEWGEKQERFSNIHTALIINVLGLVGSAAVFGLIVPLLHH